MKWWFLSTHISWAIAWLSLGFVVGVWSAMYVGADLWLFWAGLVLVVLSLLYPLRLVVLVGVLAAWLVGLSYGSQVRGDLEPYERLIGNYIELTGRVKEDPSISSGSQLSLQLADIEVVHSSLPGFVLATTGLSFDIKRGDIVTLKGNLKEGLGSFSATMFRANVVKIVRPEPGDVGRRVRDWFADAVRRVIKDPQASLGIGYLTGQKSALPEDLAESLKIVGLTHIVVASGYNLTILVRMSRRLFLRVSKYLSAVSASIMIVSFVSVTGMSPSMTRAGLVSGMSLFTWYYGGVFHPVVLLSFAAMLTVALQPSYAWGDLGWQLSFAAFLGVMIISPLLQRYFFGEKEPGSLRQILGETISAHIATVPVIAINFGVISNIAIVANLMVVPLVPLAMLLTFISGVLSLLNVPAELVSVPTEWLLTYMTSTAEFLADISWSQSNVELPWWGWVCYILLVGGVSFWMWRKTALDFRQHNPVL